MPLPPSSLPPAVSLVPVSAPALTEDGASAALRRTSQPVANAADLPPGQIIGYTLLNTELVVTRFTDGRLLAADTACPHKGARLTAGCIRAGELVMPGDTVATAFPKQFRRWLLAGANPT